MKKQLPKNLIPIVALTIVVTVAVCAAVMGRWVTDARAEGLVDGALKTEVTVEAVCNASRKMKNEDASKLCYLAQSVSGTEYICNSSNCEAKTIYDSAQNKQTDFSSPPPSGY